LEEIKMIKKYHKLHPDAIAIREEVFVQEQGFEEEFDTIDSHACHLIYYEGPLPVAVCRYYTGDSEGVFILGRLAVRSAYRGKHLGKIMLEKAEQEITQEGGQKVILSAQITARPFYKKCGYKALGSIYLDEGCPHIRMEKVLSAEGI
jgi:predicted GNAT family N-acyltransferase